MASTSSNAVQDNQFLIYKKLSGIRDVGREFEHAMCGCYAVKLAISNEVEDFKMTSNNGNDGKFDDIGLEITFKNQNPRKFLFQLKHKSKNINLADLKSEGKKNDFSVQKYMKSISEMNVNEEAVCILFTNSSTEMRGNIQVTNEITFEQSNQLEFPLENFFINTEDGKENRIFEIKSASLKPKFYYFTSQMSIKKTEEKINSILKSLCQCEIYGVFATYIRNWWAGTFVLTKHDVLAKISELALSPYLRTLTDKNCNEKTESLRKAIMEFPLTIVEGFDENIETIWKSDNLCTKDELLKSKAKYEVKDQECTALWYLGKVPLIVRVDDSNAEIIKSVMNILQKDFRNKKIILFGKVSQKDFESWNSFLNLSDILKKCQETEHCSDIMEIFKISLQGRGCITLEELVGTDSDVATLIGTRELLKMSHQEYLLVGNRKEMSLPDSHIPRNVASIFIKTEDVLEFCQSSRNTLVIVNSDESCSSKIAENKNVHTMELSQFLSETPKEIPGSLILLSTKNKCTNIQFEDICKKITRTNVYLLQQLNNGSCILILSKGEQFSYKGKEKTETIKETEIFQYYNNPLHVFCACPGMGKSTILKVLYNTCPSDCLAVYVNLIDYNCFFAKQPGFEAILNQFLANDKTENVLFKQLKQFSRHKQKLYMFLDGLDEVNSEHVKTIMNFVKQVSSEGVNVWISSRENLRGIICQTLNAVPLDIKELDKEEQERYIHHKLKQSYEEEQLKKIKTAVFNSTDLNNSQNLLGIPLQLYIITEMFINDEGVYETLETKNFFVLTNMYKIFFEGKMTFACSKAMQKPQLGFLKYILQGYELPALKACLDKKDYEKLDLDQNDSIEFLDELRTEGDKFGITKRIDENNHAIFEHQTYAEYFACVWFRKNPNKIPLLRNELFSKRYDNLRLMFDVMLSEKNPLHLAVIYQDFEKLEKHIKDIDGEDKGGRTVFHVAFSYGQKYYNSTIRDNSYFKDVERRETSTYVKIIERLLQQGQIPVKEDTLFHFDCVTYAVHSGCLYPLEKILGKKLLSFCKLEKRLYEYFGPQDLALRSAEYGFPNLLCAVRKGPSLIEDKDLTKKLLKLAVIGCHKDLCQILKNGYIEVVKMLIEKGDPRNNDILESTCKNQRVDMLEILLKNDAKCNDGNTILHDLVYCCPENCLDEIINTITKFNIDVNAKNVWGATALHKASESADLKIVETLIEKDANLNELDNFGQSALHSATFEGRKEIIKLLLDRGSIVNAQDRRGATALHLASQRGDTEIVKILLKQGADLHIPDHKKNNALHYALMIKSCKTQDTIKLLISKNLDVNAKNDGGWAPIHFAYMEGDFEKADFLSKLGANPDINAIFKDEQTPLHLACFKINTQTVKKLVEEGACVNVLDNNGKSPLDIVFKSLDRNTYFSLSYQHVHESNGWQFGCETCCRELLQSLEEERVDITFKECVKQKLSLFVRHHERIDFFLKHVLTTNYEKKSYEIIREIVARFIQFELINFLIENGSKISDKTASHYMTNHYREFPEIEYFINQ